ncbi:MAG: hypothetical protein F4118_13080 [Acidimicrobiaceae bacterium]|nr:hypothetical protein [Acidimicrobiaceae bacterium]
MICSYHLSPKPGGFLLARLCDAARDYMKHFDADAAVEPMTFTLEPFVVYERVPFVLHRADGKTWTDNVSGRTAHGILEGNTDDLDFYLKVFAGEKTVKITHEDTVIWQR